MLEEQKQMNERIQDILNQSFVGLLLKDEKVTDISFNGTTLWIQHNEKGRFKAEKQPTLSEVRQLAKQIADIQKKEITNTEPVLDTEIGFLRMNVMHDVISPDGMTFAIRVSRPRLAIRSIADITVGEREEVEELLNVLVQAGSNIVISGRTGAGKTELQKLLVGFIPNEQKISLLEDTRDSHIKRLYPEKDINSWQTIPGLFSMSDGVKAALRNNPDWVLVSETRGEEAADMLDSVKTDHSIITTLHAKGAMNIPARLIPMIRQAKAYARTDEQLLGREITGLIRFGVHLHLQEEDGRMIRRIKEIVEFTDFTPQGAKGSYLYRASNSLNEQGAYEVKETFGRLSKQTLDDLKDKKLYHLVPDVFKEEYVDFGLPKREVLANE